MQKVSTVLLQLNIKKVPSDFYSLHYFVKFFLKVFLCYTEGNKEGWCRRQDTRQCVWEGHGRNISIRFTKFKSRWNVHTFRLNLNGKKCYDWREIEEDVITALTSFNWITFHWIILIHFLKCCEFRTTRCIQMKKVAEANHIYLLSINIQYLYICIKVTSTLNFLRGKFKIFFKYKHWWQILEKETLTPLPLNELKVTLDVRQFFFSYFLQWACNHIDFFYVCI